MQTDFGRFYRGSHNKHMFYCLDANETMGHVCFVMCGEVFHVSADDITDDDISGMDIMMDDISRDDISGDDIVNCLWKTCGKLFADLWKTQTTQNEVLCGIYVSKEAFPTKVCHPVSLYLSSLQSTSTPPPHHHLPSSTQQELHKKRPASC